ncbi:kinase-like domain-containing protein [Pavlovales sp. CCMP2436]|nr:kinase-like domain-containing protein [Pavlovales sp. CCMP2436]
MVELEPKRARHGAPPVTRAALAHGALDVSEVKLVQEVHDAVDESGRRMINGYSVVRSLGHGSFGEVSLVEDLQRGRSYALKQMRRPRAKPKLSLGPFAPAASTTTGAADDDVAAPVRREIAVLKKLSHVHIISLHEVLDDPSSDSVFLVMQLAPGGQMMEGSVRAQPLPEAEARTHFRALLSALAHMHARGVTHGDLKPENFLLGQRRQLLVGDFGLARLWDGAGWMHGLPESGGTPAFCCPERLADGLSGPDSLQRADMWAAGVCLHCMLDGAPPFVARSVPDLLDLIVHAQPTIGAGVPESTRGLILGLLRKGPTERLTLLEAAQHEWVARAGADEGPWTLPAEGPEAAVEPTADELARALVPIDRLVSLLLLRTRFGAAVRLQKIVRGRIARRRAMGCIRTCRSAALCLQLYVKAKQARASGDGGVMHAARSALFNLFWGSSRRRQRAPPGRAA